MSECFSRMNLFILSQPSECVCKDYSTVQPHKCPCWNVEAALGGGWDEEEDGGTPALTMKDKEGNQGAAPPPTPDWMTNG